MDEKKKINLTKIKAMLKAKHLTQSDVANATGLCLMSVNRKMLGRREFRAGELIGLANLLGVSTNDLFD